MVIIGVAWYTMHLLAYMFLWLKGDNVCMAIIAIQYIDFLLTLNYSTTHKDILRPVGLENCTDKQLGYPWFLSIKCRPLSLVASRILLIAEELLARERNAIPVGWVPRLGTGNAYQLPKLLSREASSSSSCLSTK